MNDKNAQLVALEINKVLSSEIIDTNNTLNIRQGNDAEVAQLVSEMKSGKIAGLISYNVDPVYSLPNSSEFIEGLNNLEISSRIIIRK